MVDVKTLNEEVALHAHGQVPAALRRRQILAVAHELFSERGYRGTSMQELARRVGVSKPIVYKLAGSKEELFRDVMAVASDELAAIVARAAQEHPDLEGKLGAGILAFLLFVQDNRSAWVALLSMEAGPASEVDDMRRRLATMVAALVSGSAETASDPLIGEAVGHAINGAVEFVASWWLSHPTVAVEPLAQMLTELLTPGLLALIGGSDT